MEVVRGARKGPAQRYVANASSGRNSYPSKSWSLRSAESSHPQRAKDYPFAEEYEPGAEEPTTRSDGAAPRASAGHARTINDDGRWERVIGINLTGQFLCSREAVREFLRRGVRPQISRAAGKIVCVSSVHDAIPWAGHANYAASKGGVAMLMKTMAQELAGRRIRVNSISPGAIKTPINTAAWATPEAEAELLRLIPYGRVGETSDIARAAVWLASDQSDYVNGATIYVDGGMTLYPEFRTGG